MKFDDGLRVPDGSASLRDRRPARVAISEFLRVQSEVAPRSRSARVFGRSPLSSESRRWFWEVIGQLEVAGALSHLGQGWTVLHSIPIGDNTTQIDHLIVGPPGVFTVKTRNHSGQSVWVAGRAFMVSGHRLPHIRMAEAEVGRAEALLAAAVGVEVTVTAIIVVVDPGSLTVRDLPRDVLVASARGLLRCLHEQAPVLSTESVDLLSGVAATESTWRSECDQAVDTTREREEFETIRHDVFTARLLRQLWVIAGAVLAMAAILALGCNQFPSGNMAGS